MSDTNDKKGQFLYATPVTGVYLGEETLSLRTTSLADSRNKET